MRPFLVILITCYSCRGLAQDSLVIDTTVKTFNPTVQDTLITDTPSSVSNGPALKNKKPAKKLKRKKATTKPVGITEDNAPAVAAAENIKALAITGILIIAGIGALFLLRSTWPAAEQHVTKDDEFISDYLSRKFLPRREYYNNVYLK